MKTPGKFCADNWILPGGALEKAIAGRDAEWAAAVQAQADSDMRASRAALAASEHALRVAVEHARDAQARLDEAQAFVRRVAKMGATVIQSTRLELDAIALVKWWDSSEPDSVESPGVAGDRCAKLECRGLRVFHDANTHDFVEPVPAGNAVTMEATLTDERIGELLEKGARAAAAIKSKAPAPERDPCAACQGRGGFTSLGNPEPEWRALGPGHACGRCDGTGVAK